ncbi:MAG: hypothetical protein ACRDA5_10655 [Clostridium sp.]
MELELIDILSNLYTKYGTTDEVLKLSRVIDVLVVNQQKVYFQKYISIGKLM